MEADLAATAEVEVQAAEWRLLRYAYQFCGLRVPGFPVGATLAFLLCEMFRSLSRTLFRESTPKRSFRVPSRVRGSTFLILSVLLRKTPRQSVAAFLSELPTFGVFTFHRRLGLRA